MYTYLHYNTKWECGDERGYEIVWSRVILLRRREVNHLYRCRSTRCHEELQHSTSWELSRLRAFLMFIGVFVPLSFALFVRLLKRRCTGVQISPRVMKGLGFLNRKYCNWRLTDEKSVSHTTSLFSSILGIPFPHKTKKIEGNTMERHVLTTSSSAVQSERESELDVMIMVMTRDDLLWFQSVVVELEAGQVVQERINIWEVVDIT